MNETDMTAPLSPELLDAELSRLAAAYPSLLRRTLGRSLLGREIPLLLLGRGSARTLYVGAHHASEWLTSRLLLTFLSELLAAHAEKERPFDLDLSFLLSVRTLLFVPMLNPDGVAIQMGADGDPLAERRLRMVEDGDFTHWQANARGVDLNHNYRTGFSEYKKQEAALGILGGAPTRYSGEGPESEPETAALAGFIRAARPRFLMSLHTQGEEIYYAGGGVELPGARATALRLAGLSGYRVALAEGPAAYGGLADYTTASLGIPSFTVECGLGENPLPCREIPAIYRRVRRMLFESMTM